MKKRLIQFSGIALITLLSSVCGHSDNWPQYLGPQRDGVWRETGIIERFPEGGPKLLWKTAINAGFSGPSVASGRVFVMDRQAKPVAAKDRDAWKRANIPGNERVVCLDATSGKIVWAHEYDCPYTTATAYATGPRVTPTVDDKLVFTLGSEGNFLALQTSDGTVAWSRDFRKDYGLEVPVWGMASHPLVVGDSVVSMVGGKDASVVAFDKRTGSELWRALKSEQPGYAPPMLYDIEGELHLVVWNSDTVAGLNPKSGKVYWSTTVKPDFAMAIAAPRLEGRRLFLSYHRGKSAMIEITESLRDASVAWYGNTRVGIGTVMSTPFLREGLIYGSAFNGELMCADLESGKRLWRTFSPYRTDRKVAWGNMFLLPHEDRFFLALDTGELLIAKISSKGYEELDRAQLIEPNTPIGRRTLVWSHPAFANRNIYLRNDTEIRCYSLAAE